jgi:hypothetical protein
VTAHTSPERLRAPVIGPEYRQNPGRIFGGTTETQKEIIGRGLGL